ncbi:helix-turn-helix domain-containing protein [Acidianus manzaensis]|uniref:XRE family transcriptional regulator n=1 Tax=Acidianus manzaensis TaxID=282676 RepID=A0A1W6K364_9CREN|nr:helix-turn-helix domain-containing protein [Acidianus manzaensis]ARM76925.1 XRE family transcriptional regulator [Acidianus manzaensis]
MNGIYNVKLTISHKGCWTEHVKYKVKTIKISNYNNKKVKVIVISPFNITKELKNADNVEEIVKYNKLNEGYIIQFLEDKDSTISGTLIEFEDDILDYSNVVNRGIEIWNITTTNKRLTKIFIDKFGAENVNIEKLKLNNLLRGTNLTEKELLSLKTAVMMGYFNYPRNVKAKDIATVLGISKQAFLYNLRNCINKIIMSVDLDNMD